MTILQIITELEPAGAERIVAELSKGLKRKGHRVIVVSLRPANQESVIVRELQQSRIPVKSLLISKPTFWRYRKLEAIIEETRPDVVHAHLFHANIITRLCVLGKRHFRLINTVHIVERRPGKWWHFLLDRLTFWRCDCQTAVSLAVQRYHSGKIGVAPACIPVVYNGIPAPRIVSLGQRKKLRREWGVDACNVVIGSVGRLNRQKGYDLLLMMLPQIAAALAKSAKKKVKLGLVILGQGPERQRLEVLARNHCPADVTVVLPGYRADASRCIGAFDLFVMPSRYEGFGLTLIEAMAHGVPILTSNVDSLPELLENYPKGAAVSFTASTDHVVSEMRRLLTGRRRTPRIRFTTEKMVNAYLRVYRQPKSPC